MPERLLFALVAAAFALSPSLGNAQSFSGRSRPLPPMGAPAAATSPYGAQANGFGEAPRAYPAYDEPSAVAADPNHRLQPGDQLSVKILEDRESAAPVTVGQGGDVVVDPIPTGIKVSGLTVAEASSQIKRLLEKDYYYTATVRLTLDRAMPAKLRTAVISGQVNRVGLIPLPADRSLKVSEACLAGGSGFTKFADDRRVTVTRTSSGKTERILVDVKSILKEGKVERDMAVQEGDQIFVPAVIISTN